MCTVMIPFIRRNCKEMVTSVDANIVSSLLNLVTSFLGIEDGRLDLNKAQLENANQVVMNYLTFAVAYSIGANLHDSSR